jgi:sigma-B regulation protein RsbU (phosphoserine phosphatase)
MNAAARTAYSTSKTLLNLLQSHRKYRRTWELVCVFAAYLLAGEIGLAVPFTSGNVSPLWPPAGVALAAMLVLGYRVWPAVALGAFIVNFFSKIPHVAAAGIALGNTVGPLCGTWLLRQLPRFQPSLTRLRDVLGMSIFGALGGTAVSATIGASVLFLTGVNAWSGFASAWLMWWLGDAIGVLIVTPLVLTFTGLMSIREDRRLFEFACLLLGAAGSALMIFDPRLGLMRAGMFAFGVFPFVLWGAIRFETAGAAVVSFLISAIAVWGTARGLGPFIKGNALQNATLLQSFLGVTSVSGIILAAVIAERAQLIREQSAHEALEQSEKSYRSMVETAYEGIWKVDSNFITSFVNGRMAKLLGYTVEEMLGKPLFDFLFESDIEQKRSDLQRRRRGVSEQLEDRFRKKDGSVLWARVATSPIIGEDGRFEGALAMISDMTEQKRTEAEERRSQETISLLSRAVEQTADSVVITDVRGTIEYVNPAFEATTGYGRAEALGKTPAILKSGLHDKEFYRRLWDQILRDEAFRGTLVNRKKSGELYWAEQTITPIKDSAGAITHFVSVLKDVTALRKMQEQEFHMALARELQQRYYNTTASLPGFDIAAAAYPADTTGGDYFDFIPRLDGSLYIVVADIAGHGFGSALLMAQVRASLRAYATMVPDISSLLNCINRSLIGTLGGNRFVTMFLGRIDPHKRLLEYASAGHEPGYLLRSSGDIRAVLASTAVPLGIFPDQQFYSGPVVPLERGDTILLLTDGITESEDVNGGVFGTEGALDFIRCQQQSTAGELVQGLYRAARAFADGAPQIDDIMALICKVE